MDYMCPLYSVSVINHTGCTADDVDNHRKYDSVDYTPELNEWIQQGNEKEGNES